MKGRGISRDAIPNFKYTLSVGYIIIPDNFKGERNRDEFIQNCYRRERVSVMYEGGGLVKHDCFITVESLRDIVFPNVTVNERLNESSSVSRLGSMVVMISEPYHDQAVVLGVISKLDESNLFSENEYRIVRKSGGNFALISINGKNGGIGITTFGENSGGDLNIMVSNNSNSAKLNIGVRGNVVINVTGNVDLISAGDINLKPNKLNIGEENLEPTIKGDVTVEELNKDNDILSSILDIITGSTIMEPGEGAPSAFQAALKSAVSGKNVADYSQIKSKKTFIE